MKFLDYLFHGKELKAIGNYFKMLNGYSPTFTSFSGGVYEMDLTRTAINNFATHCSKSERHRSNLTSQKRAHSYMNQIVVS